MKLKKVLITSLVLLLAVLLVACGKKEFTVSFESNGGSPVAAQTVKKGEFAERPAVPTRDGFQFDDWFANQDLSGTAYGFATAAVTADVKLYAKWTEVLPDEAFARFTDHRQNQSYLVTTNEDQGLVVGRQLDPIRDGFKFGGWFTTKQGLTWLETEPVQLPLTLEVGQSVEFFAYWEPVNSVEIDWAESETYRSSITKQARMILNPLTYENNLEDDLIANMATSLYATEVDWDKAISQGVADFPGDFSKIESEEYSVEALDYHYVLVGASDFPLNADGDNLLDENGNYDRKAATSRTSSEWTFSLRDDIFFQDGSRVTAYTYEYTLKQYLDKAQNNYRANTMYRTQANPNGVPIKNAFEYFSQQRQVFDAEGKPVLDADDKHVYEDAVVTWDEVGFEVIDEFTFKLEFHTPYSQAAAVSFGSFRLVHPERYAASLTSANNSTYGTPDTPYISYGQYVLKYWDEDQKLVFNKNYNYVGKGNVNYKSIVYEIVENTEQTLNLYKAGSIDVIGLNANNYAELAETGSVYRSFTGYPNFLTINTAPSRATANKYEHPTILFDVRFRQALMYAFDRVDYNANYDIPNVPSFIPVPSDIKNYVQDTSFFTDSVEYLEVLQKLGVTAESFGYLPTKALDLFNESYAAWLAEGNTGPVTLKLIAPDSTITKLTSARVKAMYESFFQDAAGNKRLIIDVHNLASAQRSQVSANWDFDLTLGGIGFGGSTGTYWQMGAIAFMGGMLGGADLGLSQPYTTDLETGERVLAPYATTVLEIDLTTTYNRLVALGGIDYLEAEELENTIEVFKMLEEHVDEDTGEVIKAAGIMKETVYDIMLMLFGGDEPWDATAEEPFPGAGTDANRIAAAMLEVFYNHVTHIPTGGSASATLYAMKVTVDWPAYSTAFGWGAARYRYLNTDVDFQ